MRLITLSPRLGLTGVVSRTISGEDARAWASRGLIGDRAGHSSSVPGEIDLRNGFSVASRSDRRWTGDLDTKVATGMLGRGFSVGEGRESFFTGCGKWDVLREGLGSLREGCRQLGRHYTEVNVSIPL